MTANASTDLNVSLESHVVSIIKRVLDLVPQELHEQLLQYATDTPPPKIPYNTLHVLSRWARSPPGINALQNHEPRVDTHDLTMINLLAGAKTSPEKPFPAPAPVEEPEDVEANRLREKRAIAALANSLLSIGGAGFAAWWAAEKTGWANEWRVLFALFVAIVVAVAEGVLFLIWESRRTSKPRPRRRQILRRSKSEEKPAKLTSAGGQDDPIVDGVEIVERSGLRHRT
ncbi:hypothetical protein BDN72DRAFT_832640 [Pluteus cervinus]|uniref:Uncharacterized protein n=1 Tax=Pluteus cervinus TaxID=181527 RepID=A0ACD3BB34_9AGAR|nr:hypothetical protein BDN72DRAFT_832640 [Pluteus cervinus]